MKDIKRLIPGALISLALIAAILYFVDFHTLWNAILTANYLLLAVSAVLSFFWMFCRAKVWQTLLRDKPKYVDVLFSASEGYLLNNFYPSASANLDAHFYLAENQKWHSVKYYPPSLLNVS